MRSRRFSRIPWRLRYDLGARAASGLRRITVLATHRHCHVEFQGPVRLGPGFTLHIPDAGTLIVGRGVEFRRGFVCEISGNGRVQIGDASVFTSNALIQCTTSIDIGRRCLFGQSALLVDGVHRFRDPTKHLLDQGYDYRPVVIEDGAVILAKCTVIADVGEGTVVGPHSVVSRPLPPRCLAVGSPARPVEFFKDPATISDTEQAMDGGG